MKKKTHRSAAVAGDGGGGGPTLAAGASGGHRYLDGATGLAGAGGRRQHMRRHICGTLNWPDDLFRVESNSNSLSN